MLDKNHSEKQLKSARKETERLRAENARLRAMLGIPDSAVERGSPPEVNAVETLTQGKRPDIIASSLRDIPFG